MFKSFKNHLFWEHPTHSIFTEQVQRLVPTLSGGFLEHCGGASSESVLTRGAPSAKCPQILSSAARKDQSDAYA
jgi:hypothetical protein